MPLASMGGWGGQEGTLELGPQALSMNLEGECVHQALSGSLWTRLYLQEWAGTTKEVSDKTSALFTVYAQESRE